jgi:glycosyltransferase involved in cell wall biosynthesis
MNRVLHTIADLHSSKGGPSRTVPNLCRALLLNGKWDPQIIVAASADDVIMHGPKDPLRAHIQSASREGMAAAIRRISAGVQRGRCIVHDHGVWLYNNVAAARMARRVGLPLMVSPRGMLEPWAFAHRAWKKRPAWWLYQRPLLSGAAAFHATSEEEALNLRRLGLRQPVAVISNGVDEPGDTAMHAVAGQRQALFLSRLNVKKGVLELLDAWASVRPAGWRLLLVGPDEDGYRAQVEARIAQHELAPMVTVCGEVADRAKWQLYADSDLFVLPSFSENFGVVVAEALVSGLPVITTTGTPWQGLVEHDCGWWVAPRAVELGQALAHATSLDSAELRAMGQRGRAWARSAFAWPGIGRAMAGVYDWLAAGAPRGTAPECVMLD